MQLTRGEQETFIRANAASREWDFWTFDPKYVRLVERKGYKLEKDYQGGWSCKLPLNAVTVRKLKLEPAQRSEKQIAAGKRNLQAPREGVAGRPEGSATPRSPEKVPLPAEAHLKEG